MYSYIDFSRKTEGLFVVTRNNVDTGNNIAQIVAKTRRPLHHCYGGKAREGRHLKKVKRTDKEERGLTSISSNLTCQTRTQERSNAKSVAVGATKGYIADGAIMAPIASTKSPNIM